MPKFYEAGRVSRYWTGFAGLMISLAPACGLLQRSTKAKESTELNSRQLQKVTRESLLEGSSSTTQQELNFEDSSGSYQVEIWPKGRFSFEPGKGFEAEAEKVRISAQQNRSAGRLQQYSNAAAQRQLKVVEATAAQEQASSQQRLKQERHPAWGWALILLAVLLIFERFFPKSRSSFVP